MAEGEGRIGTLAIVGVALLALLTAGVVVFTRADAASDEVATFTDPTPEPTPRPAELAQAWQARDAVGRIDGATGASRVWVNESVVTRVSTAGVTGFGAIDGGRRWQAEQPDGAGPPCAAAERTSAAGLGAVFHEDDEGSCSVLAVIDTRDGTLRWSHDLSDFLPDPEPEPEPEPEPGQQRPGDGITVTMGEQTVAVNLDAAGTPEGFHRFAATTGEELPVPGASTGDPDTVEGCAADGHVQSIGHAGSRVLAVAVCGGGTYRELRAYDTDTGAPLWTFVPGDPDYAVTDVVSGNPVILLEGNELVAYSETGEPLWRLPAPGPATAGPALVARLVAGDVLVIESPGEAGDDERVFAGHALSEGERLWTSRVPGDARLFGVDTGGQPLLGHPAGAAGDQLRLTRLDPADGAEQSAGTVPFPRGGARHDVLLANDTDQLYVLSELPPAGAGGPREPRLRLRAFER